MNIELKSIINTGFSFQNYFITEYKGISFDYIFQWLHRVESYKMANIDQFLLDFENLIFDEHLDGVKTFKGNNGNAVSCRC